MEDITGSHQDYENVGFCDLTLDPNTANGLLILSEENRKITCVVEQQSYQDHPDRFNDCEQVLCKESLTGHCYWEVNWNGYAYISVSYKGISRKGGGDDCRFGWNEKSWSLFCTVDRFSAWHNNRNMNMPVPSPPSSKIGVYLDWMAGTLSFYSVSDTHTLTHIHTFNTTFKEPLYAGFNVYSSSSTLSLCGVDQPPVKNT
ncbi:Stonustoxin subunit beta [Labeo rohita]|uniref:Stonustoxin subunit beta n=1 Tax=Labeo rohita TaxID=84645 RepID=A0ABQ8LAZ5_LABRO|nr:Stonustoxin subunit beta [Labeo rohita]